MANPAPFELFHAIADAPSAQVRRAVVEFDLNDQIRFRNVAYPEVQADLTSRGANQVPALWDGTHWVLGADAIISRLKALRVSERSEKSTS
jgi:hypothetical protein